ncbi:hypothetical protein Jiend_14810 [Micromonospora endophytica]|nr:hypothetical protein D3H59_16470 [Micromonospora endophytica]BCJ58059.1 hypothetical protein Jiend_14810 [Micromonospora endophytica]
MIRVTGEPAVEQHSHDETPQVTAVSQGAVAGRTDPRRTHLVGGVALIVIAVLIGVVALRAGSPEESIRGEFVAGVPYPDNAGAEQADSGWLPGPDGTGSDVRGVGAISASPTADSVVRPGLNPRTEGGGLGNPDSGPAAPIGAPANPAPQVPPLAPGAPAAPATPATPAAPAAPPAAPASPAGPALVPGARIGLEVAGLPGHRVRHANFEARVDPVNAGSNAGTKADAAFVVRSGLGKSDCVSFEAVNYPGYYLRHSGFRVFLHRAEGSAGFRADATFCPVTGIGGKHTSLRSHNYPDRYLSHDSRRQMRIAPIGDGATSSTAAFLIRPAL